MQEQEIREGKENTGVIEGNIESAEINEEFGGASDLAGGIIEGFKQFFCISHEDSYNEYDCVSWYITRGIVSMGAALLVMLLHCFMFPFGQAFTGRYITGVFAEFGIFASLIVIMGIIEFRFRNIYVVPEGTESKDSDKIDPYLVFEGDAKHPGHKVVFISRTKGVKALIMVMRGINKFNWAVAYLIYAVIGSALARGALTMVHEFKMEWSRFLVLVIAGGALFMSAEAVGRGKTLYETVVGDLPFKGHRAEYSSNRLLGRIISFVVLIASIVSISMAMNVMKGQGLEMEVYLGTIGGVTLGGSFRMAQVWRYHEMKASKEQGQ
jgi:hypothetical protein